MKFAVYFAALLAVLGSTGCIFGKHKHQEPPPAYVDLTTPTGQPPVTTNTFLVTPDDSINGRVTMVNQNLRFVVLTFPIGQMPAVGSRMNVFRNGSIVGEVKISEPQRDNNSTADIIYGDARKGDEVRAK